MNWQPIETAPKDGCKILCVVREDDWAQPRTEILLLKWFEDIGLWVEEYDYMAFTQFTDDEVLYWMPLPEVPE